MTGHGVDTGLRAEVRVAARPFFALPDDPHALTVGIGDLLALRTPSLGSVGAS